MEQVFNDFHRYLLVDGPRKSGKTLGVLHKVCRHLYECPGAIYAIIAKTSKQAKAAGTWRDMVDFIIPQWIDAGIGFNYALTERMDPLTKMSYLRVTSRTGMTSELQLHSVEYAREAAAKFKSARFSGVYLSEADLFDDKIIFTVLRNQLRSIVVPRQMQQLICDANPPEEGLDHWLAQTFNLTPREYVEGQPHLFNRIQILLRDNPWLNEDDLAEQESATASDPILHQRWFEGIWVKDMRKTHFFDVLTPRHFAGKITGPPDTWEVLVPSRESFEFSCGWDPGDVNHGVAFAAKRKYEDDSNPRSAFDFIDEVSVIGSRVSLEDLTDAVLEKILKWEDFMSREYGVKKIMWRHWGDTSAWRYRSAVNSYDALLIRDFSRGKIIVKAVMKGANSVRRRVTLLRRMLAENRVTFSANLPACRAMLHDLKRGPSSAQFVYEQDPNKHMFDAVTYDLAHESPIDMEERLQQVVKRRSLVLMQR